MLPLKVLPRAANVQAPPKSARFAHLKRDGHCAIIHRSSVYPEGLKVWTRRPTDITARAYYLCGNILKHCPEGTILLAELWKPGDDASGIKTALKAQDPGLRLDVFAVPSCDASESLHSIAATVAHWGLPFVEFETLPSDDIDYARRTKQDRDIEGFVFKESNLLGWSKWKPEHTLDLIIEGYTEGKGANLGLIGAICCKTIDGKSIATVGGLTAKQRVDFSYEPDRYLGKVVEVRYTSVTKYGRLRHPRFVRLRDDKHPALCTVFQDPRLENYWK